MTAMSLSYRDEIRDTGRADAGARSASQRQAERREIRDGLFRQPQTRLQLPAIYSPTHYAPCAIVPGPQLGDPKDQEGSGVLAVATQAGPPASIVARLRRAEAAGMEARLEVRPSISGALGGSGWTTVQRKCNATPTTSSHASCHQRRSPEHAAFHVALSIGLSREGSCAQRAFATDCGFVRRSSRNGSRRERKRLKRPLARGRG
jgi:hypothetical protein